MGVYYEGEKDKSVCFFIGSGSGEKEFNLEENRFKNNTKFIYLYLKGSWASGTLTR